VFGLKSGKWQTADGKEYTVSQNEAMAEIEIANENCLQLRYIEQ
jgi:hypothetical protein